MHKKLTIIHTTTATINSIPTLIHEIYGNTIELCNILDDSLLNEIKMKGNLTNEVIERFVQYAIIAKNNASDAILLACSSIGKAGDIAREIIDIPLFKIDEPMADIAVEKGNSILVLGTVKSTLLPTSALIKSKRKNTSQNVECLLIPDVFKLFNSNREHHDQIIGEVINEKRSQYDVIVLAQASMSNAIKYVDGNHDNILTSLPLGLHQLKNLFINEKEG